MSLRGRVVRFVLVGGLCFIVQWRLLHVIEPVVHLYFAEIIAFLVSAQLNFVLSRSITWGDRRDSERLAIHWIKFNASALVSVLIVNATVFWMLVLIGFWHWSAMLVANAVSTMFTFVMNNIVVFKTDVSVTQLKGKDDRMQGKVTSAAFFLPAHNEAENLPHVVSHACEFFDTAHIERSTVIVIDDGSTDQTPEVIDRIRATHEVTVVRHDKNQGYGGALRSGFQAALATGHEWIVFCDSDGQFDPKDMALLFNAAQQQDRQVAIGYRAQRADNWHRRAAGRAWHTLSQAALGFHAQDVDCGFKLFHRDALCPVVPKLCGEHATISPELLARLHREGYEFAEVAIPHYPRQHGEQSGMNIHVMWSSLVGLYQLRHDLV